VSEDKKKDFSELRFGEKRGPKQMRDRKRARKTVAIGLENANNNQLIRPIAANQGRGSWGGGMA